MTARRRLAVLAVALSLVAAGCGDDKKKDTTTPVASGAATTPAAAAMKIGFITKFPVDFYDIMVDAVKTWNKDHSDVEVIFAQGKSGTDDESEIAAIESMISQGVKAIAITPTSPNVKDALQKAVDAGIKVVLVDNDIPGWSGKSSLVATDNLAGGKLAGTFLKEKLEPGSKIIVLQGVLGAPSLDQRVDGMLETLGDAATVVAKAATDCDQTKGLNAAQDALTANPNVDAIYAACGPPILGALEAVKAAGKKPSDLLIVGFDADPGQIEAILAGDEVGSVAQFPAKMGSLGIETAYKAATGGTVEANVDTGTEMVTKDNAATFK